MCVPCQGHSPNKPQIKGDMVLEAQQGCPRGDTHTHDPHTPPCCQRPQPSAPSPPLLPVRAHREANSLEGAGALCSSPAHSCQASKAQSGASIRARFSQSVILAGALVVNNFVVPHCENEGHNGPLLNLWCDDLVQQLIKCYGNRASELFIAAFVCLRVYLVLCCFSVQC